MTEPTNKPRREEPSGLPTGQDPASGDGGPLPTPTDGIELIADPVPIPASEPNMTIDDGSPLTLGLDMSAKLIVFGSGFVLNDEDLENLPIATPERNETARELPTPTPGLDMTNTFFPLTPKNTNSFLGPFRTKK